MGLFYSNDPISHLMCPAGVELKFRKRTGCGLGVILVKRKPYSGLIDFILRCINIIERWLFIIFFQNIKFISRSSFITVNVVHQKFDNDIADIYFFVYPKVQTIRLINYKLIQLRPRAIQHLIYYIANNNYSVRQFAIQLILTITAVKLQSKVTTISSKIVDVT